jgi:hypothetical protein
MDNDVARPVRSSFDDHYLECPFAIEDDRFDLIYPPEIRDLSERHWTPVEVARRAAKLLVTKPETRVLDLGCGPGKFCVVGALTTAGHFTGVEQRSHLAKLARDTVQTLKLVNAEIIHANITEIDFSAYDAFFLFNPFEENLFKTGMIDESLELSRALYDRYTQHVAAQLARAPLGTRVVTFHGLCEEVPIYYDCEDSAFESTLKLWRKTRASSTLDTRLNAPRAGNRWPKLLDAHDSSGNARNPRLFRENCIGKNRRSMARGFGLTDC